LFPSSPGLEEAEKRAPVALRIKRPTAEDIAGPLSRYWLTRPAGSTAHAWFSVAGQTP
jgi:hypothetical protein